MPVTVTQLWTFTGLFGVELAGRHEIDLGNGFYLLGKTAELMKVLQNSFWLSGVEKDHARHVDCFYCLKSSTSLPPDREAVRFQNGLMALQVTKPLPTIGCIFQGTAFEDERPNVNHMQRRPDMRAGEWAQLRRFDAEMITKSKDILPRMLARMESGSSEQKNAVILLQLALEHFHPLIKGLFAVMGLDAFFDSKGRSDFENKLCRFLGESDPAFPDWNSPYFPPPRYTVGEVALHLYTLRSKIAHGVDLRKAAHDKKIPVDLTKRVELIEQLQARPYAAVLAEAAVYILCLVLQRDLS